ncbi:MAG: hypothetical protein RLO12_04890, partial [Fulvivirga sp.]
TIAVALVAVTTLVAAVGFALRAADLDRSRRDAEATLSEIDDYGPWPNGDFPGCKLAVDAFAAGHGLSIAVLDTGNAVLCSSTARSSTASSALAPTSRASPSTKKA